MQAVRKRLRHVLRVCTSVHILDPWSANGGRRKAASNLRKHGIDFADAALVLHDDLALTVRDDLYPDEERFITLGMDALGRVLVVLHTPR
ncbi:MAG: BrnT family toxin, partial [Deltaproteobacteria bacterium]|nr:BrnT family toxin [Deltaproteobacteria bacterium]